MYVNIIKQNYVGVEYWDVVEEGDELTESHYWA